jgi:hypothetical protein
MKRYTLALLALSLAGTMEAGVASANNIALSPKPKLVTPEISGVPSSTCRAGFIQFGWLCMTGGRGVEQYPNAVIYCQDVGARVADADDWRYRYYRGDRVPAPVGWWFGPRVDDDTALFSNQADPNNPDGEANVSDSRGYACAHDLLR